MGRGGLTGRCINNLEGPERRDSGPVRVSEIFVRTKLVCKKEVTGTSLAVQLPMQAAAAAKSLQSCRTLSGGTSRLPCQEIKIPQASGQLSWHPARKTQCSQK